MRIGLAAELLDTEPNFPQINCIGNPFGGFMKYCQSCKTHKNKPEFYKNKSKHDGMSSECKTCSKKTNKKWIEKNNERRKSICKKYYAKNSEVIIKKGAERRVKFPNQYNAIRAVRVAIDNGLLIRMPCEVCGEIKSEGHHNDYL